MKTIEQLVEEKVYYNMCSSCPDAKHCHEECVNCEEYDDAISDLLNHHLSLKKVSFKDFRGKDVDVGDNVTLLYKAYGFRGIDRASLVDAIYLGKGQWGYEFDFPNKPYWRGPIRIRKPECILYKKGGK